MLQRRINNLRYKQAILESSISPKESEKAELMRMIWVVEGVKNYQLQEEKLVQVKD